MPRRHLPPYRDDQLHEQGLPSRSLDARLILGRGLLARANQDAGEGPYDRPLELDPCLAGQLADNLSTARFQVAVVDDDFIAWHEPCDVPMHEMAYGVPSGKTNVDIGRPQGQVAKFDLLPNIGSHGRKQVNHSGDRSKIKCTHADGVRTTLLALATNESLETGKPVAVKY